MPPLRLTSLNHVSRVCEDLELSKAFYQNVLGFVEVLRPSQLEESLNGCWLFNYNMGIHLIAGEPMKRRPEINPKDDHLSFQCENFEEIVEVLDREEIPFVREVIRHNRMYVINQVFFHDPDHNMIEICTCECMPVTPLSELYKAVSLGESGLKSQTMSLDLTALEKALGDGCDENESTSNVPASPAVTMIEASV